MLVEFIQQSELAQILRQSVWLYPLINTAHIIGFALLLGAAVPLDLRLLGCWPSVPLALLVKVLRPVMITGLAAALLFGVLLFVTSPADYLNSRVFLIKILLISFALFNALMLNRSPLWRLALSENSWGARVKLQALFSMILWLSAVFLGRFIAYR